MFCTPSFYPLICTKCYLVKNFKMFFQSNWISCSQYLQGYDDDCCQSYWYMNNIFILLFLISSILISEFLSLSVELPFRTICVHPLEPVDLSSQQIKLSLQQFVHEHKPSFIFTSSDGKWEII